MTDTTAPADPAAAAETATPEGDDFEQKAVRLAKRERLMEERTDAAGGPYPVSLPITDTIAALRERYGDLEAGAETGVTAAVAGRVVFSRNTGKLCFATLQSGDGSRIQAMVRISFPLAVPGILSAGIFAFTLSWNEFLYALVFLASPQQKTIPIGVFTELVRGDVFYWGPLMAGALLGSIPVALVYSFFVEHYVTALTGAVKG